MAAVSDFDRYFLNLPPCDREPDFDQFWKKALSDLKKIPMEPVYHKSGKTSHGFSHYDVRFTGFLKHPVSGDLFIPDKTKKPKVLIHIHDYNRYSRPDTSDLDQSAAHYFIILRGHRAPNKNEEPEAKSPGLMIENILDRDTYYVKGVYLDVYRSIDMLRLMPELNCVEIGIMGKGFGAAAAVFAAAFSDRVAALVLDTPAFSYLTLSQNLSTSDATREINEFIEQLKARKKQIKTNLTYFDSVNFADAISVPVLATVAFKDTISPPECVFALFNHIQSEKLIQVYPDQGNSAGGKDQFKKSMKWLLDRIS